MPQSRPVQNDGTVRVGTGYNITRKRKEFDMLKTRLLIVAALVALLGAAPVIAQNLDEGVQSEQILKKKKRMQQPGLGQDQGQYGGEMQSSRKKLRQDMITNQGDQDTMARRLKKRQQATG